MSKTIVDKQFLFKSLISFVLIVVGVTVGLFLGNFFGFTGNVSSESLMPENIIQDTNFKLNQKFPDVTVDDLNGYQNSIEPYLTDKKTLLCFVTNGCDPCHQFVDSIAIRSVLPDESYQIILLSPDVEYFKKNYSFLAFEVDWDFLEKHHIIKFPTIMGIDSSFEIKFIHSGYIPQMDSEYIKRFI